MNKRRIDNPTLHDIVDLFGVMESRFDIIDKRFEVFNTRMDGMDARLSTVEREMGKLKVIQLDMQDDLTSALAAFDRDAKKLIDHERRIKRLEKGRV